MREATTEAEAAPAEHDFTALPMGARVGRYEIVALLGQGGFGITYRARDEQLDRDVAIKEYLPSALSVRQASTIVQPRSTKVAEEFAWGRERFVSEGRTLASLHDAPAVVRVFDFMELNGTAYIVMELVQGETLEQRLKQRGKLSPREVDDILWPLLDGLERVHEAGFLHRDIKPANILMRPDGSPTLIDFGASRAAMAGRTTAMTAIFTPAYAATEQFTSAKQGPWTDLYGVAATLYHAIAGQAPSRAFDRVFEDGYQPLTKLSPKGFSPGLLAGLDAGLAVRASDRPQSIAGWRPILRQGAAVFPDAAMAPGMRPGADATVVMSKARPQEKAYRQEPAPPASPTPADAAPAGTSPVNSAKSRMGIYGAAVAIALLLLGVGGYFMVPGKPPPQTVVLQDMKIEELEKVLQARRAADAEAAERRRVEEAAQHRAAAESDSKRKADDELAKAEEQRQKAEAELVKLREELAVQRKAAVEQRELTDAVTRRAAAEEARRKIEAEMTALRQAETDARRKAAAEAEAKRLADEALVRAQAERLAADEEVKRRAEADKAQANTRTGVDKKSAEVAETALMLTTTERQRLQVALAALGFDTRGNDGAFGQRSREMIAAWQKARSELATGFLTAGQRQALLKDAATAVAKFDDERTRLDDEKRKAEAEARVKTTATSPPSATGFDGSTAPAPRPAVGPNPYDGRWSGIVEFAYDRSDRSQPLSVMLQNGVGSGSMTNRRCGRDVNYTITIQPDGKFAVVFVGYDLLCRNGTNNFGGTVKNNTLHFTFDAGLGPGANRFTMSK